MLSPQGKGGADMGDGICLQAFIGGRLHVNLSPRREGCGSRVGKNAVWNVFWRQVGEDSRNNSWGTRHIPTMTLFTA